MIYGGYHYHCCPVTKEPTMRSWEIARLLQMILERLDTLIEDRKHEQTRVDALALRVGLVARALEDSVRTNQGGDSG